MLGLDFGGIVKHPLLSILVKYGLGLGLLGVVIWLYWEPAKGPGIKDALQRPIHWQFLVTGAILGGVGLFITFIRWYVLVRAQDLPFTVPSAIRLGLIGFYLSTFLPGSVGGDLIKAAFIAREQSRRTAAVATVIVDRVVGLVGLFWLVAILGIGFQMSGLMAEWNVSETAQVALRTILYGACGILFGSLIFWGILGRFSKDSVESLAERLGRIPKVGGALGELWRAGFLYRRRGSSVASAILLAMVAHLCFVFNFFCCAATLTPVAEIPSLAMHYLLVPVGMTIQAGFPTPNGVGGGELVYSGLYDLVGFAGGLGVLASLVQRMIYWTIGLCGYLVYLRMKPGRVDKPSEPASTLHTVRVAS